MASFTIISPISCPQFVHTQSTGDHRRWLPEISA
jgi:hypothetical protein